jgi:LCCL domain
MKRCSQCNRTYTDGDLNYCLSDGKPLTIDSEEKTIVMQTSPTRKKGKFLLWLGLIGLIILIGGGVIAGLLILNYSRQGESLRAEKQNIVSLPSLPTPLALRVTPTPLPAMSSPVEESSPQTEGLKPTPNKEDTADITPIAWETTPAGFKGEDGQTYTFRCPEAGTENLIWGSDVYTQDSSICTAAVHVGRISLASGGIVTIEFRPGRSTYGSTVRNGIKSITYGEYPHSFVVL